MQYLSHLFPKRWQLTLRSRTELINLISVQRNYEGSTSFLKITATLEYTSFLNHSYMFLGNVLHLMGLSFSVFKLWIKYLKTEGDNSTKTSYFNNQYLGIYLNLKVLM